jgi:Zn finger protein HypA/HybF involved in hydrogenase expression
VNAGVSTGLVYRCPVCGSEVIVVGTCMGEFTPRCCNQPMRVTRQRALFYWCPVCGAEIVIVRKGRGAFTPRCCNTPMLRRDLAA